MTALDLKKEAVRITRAYSFELEQRLPQGKDTRTLNLALIQTRGCSSLQEITDPWRLFFAPNDTNNTRSVSLTEALFSWELYIYKQITKKNVDHLILKQ